MNSKSYQKFIPSKKMKRVNGIMSAPNKLEQIAYAIKRDTNLGEFERNWRKVASNYKPVHYKYSYDKK